MLSTLSGYTVNSDQVYVGTYTIVMNGIRNADQTNIMIKVLRSEHPSPDDILRLQHEYEIAKLFEHEKDIVQVYALEKYENSYAIIMEKVNGVTLTDVLKRAKKLTIDEFLEISIEITEALGHIHQKNIIHKDINPNNVICDHIRKMVKLIDFGHSASLPKERAEIINPNVLEGTLAYISPEQTGRMNRGIDYRTDFYSLGATFYQMLTGMLPFSAKEPMELVHCHIAVVPKSPQEIDPSIPKVISDIVMKLLSKKAEDRYQIANGLLADLKACQKQLIETGKIESFPIGKKDVFSRFHIPEKLYGRAAEVNALMDTYKQVMQGSVGLMLVAGYSGIGKSSLVYEIHKPIVAMHGYFISGKFDQFKHNIPYAAVTAAFDDLIKQILTEPEDKIKEFKQKILDAVGSNGKIITDVIPNLTSIIGDQPDVQGIGDTESLNRFSHVFQNFIRALSSKDHPLVLFLDDLQWADIPSLKMIESLLTSSDVGHLLIIGAYRSNEVTTAHPLMSTLQNLQKQNVIATLIELGPISEEDVNDLLSDTLHQENHLVKPLTTIIYEKTAGNPFFLIQLLLSLHKDELIYFDVERNNWQWDLNKIKEKKISDNVVELMVSKLQDMNQNARSALQYASCIGNQFSLELLSSIMQKKTDALLQDLLEALSNGYIISVGESYKASTYYFAHDRIQQAAHSMIGEEDRKEIHVKLARLLLKQTPENIFDIANHYNAGIEIAEEKQQIAELNLKASIAAKEAAAFEPALRYVEYALKCVDDTQWKTAYDFMFSLHDQATKCAFLCAKYDLTEKYANTALKHAKSILDELYITQTLIFSNSSQLKQNVAVDLAVNILTKAGIPLPRKPKPYHVLSHVIKTRWLLRNKNISELYNLPEMQDKTKQVIVKLLTSVYAPSFQSEPSLFPILVCVTVQLSVQYGNTQGSSFGYDSFGIILCGIIGDAEKGYQFGQLALRLVEKLHDEENRTRVNFFYYTMIKHWKDPVHEYLPQYIENFHIGINHGDLEFGCYSIAVYCMDSLYSGIPLATIITNVDKFIPVIQKHAQTNSYNHLAIHLQGALNLNKKVEHPSILIGDRYNESELFDQLVKVNDETAIEMIFTVKMMLHYYFWEYHDALIQIRNADKHVAAIMSTIVGSSYYYYKCLTLLALHQDFSILAKMRNAITIKSIIKKFASWSHLSPKNYTQRYLLLQAEYQLKVKGNPNKAASLYDQAIAAARQNEYLNDEALANELAAKFYLSQGSKKIARVYMIDARHCYLLWNANTKVEHLEKHYPELLGKVNTAHMTDAVMSSEISNSSAFSASLDISTILKASAAISSTIVLSDLLNKLVHIAIENAGAEKSYLLLNKGETLTIEAEGNVNKEVNVLQSIEPTSDILPMTLIHYIFRSKEFVVLNNATQSNRFMNDPYITTKKPISILALPLINQGVITGILYLENNLTEGAFTEDRVHILNLLSSQIAISLQNARLYYQATHDPLTGLGNRILLYNSFESSANREPKPDLAILLFDLDHFKNINDTLGHDVGDKVLIHVSNLLTMCIGSKNTVARLGGDEFCAIIEYNNISEITNIGDKFLDNIRKPLTINGNVLNLSSSFGISLYPQDGNRISDLLKMADIALYRVKDKGRNQYQFYSAIPSTVSDRS